MSFFKIAGVLGALAVSVSAHGHVNGVVSNGVYHAGTSPEWIYHPEKPSTAGWYAKNQDNGFVDPTKFADGDIICHIGATPGLGSIPVTAGESIDILWDSWPKSHHGPVLDYLAPVDGEFADVDKTALRFFKIDEAGLKDGSSAPGSWASDDIIANNNTWSLTIPASIAPGKYVLRHEIIALHSANQDKGAQNYPQCLNIEVTSEGTDSPAGEPATSFYKSSDAGIKLSIYQAPVEYTIPGPALYSGAGSSPSKPRPSGSASSSSPANPSSSSPASTTTAVSSHIPPPYSNITYSSTVISAPSSIHVAPTTTSVAQDTDAPSTQQQPTAASNLPSTTSEVQSISAPTFITKPSSAAASTPPAYPPIPPQTSAPVATKAPSGSGYGSRPHKALPKGFTLEDLQQWVAYLLKQGWKSRRNHARNFDV